MIQNMFLFKNYHLKLTYIRGKVGKVFMKKFFFKDRVQVQMRYASQDKNVVLSKKNVSRGTNKRNQVHELVEYIGIK